MQSGRSSIAACTQWALSLLVPRAADHCRANLQTQRKPMRSQQTGQQSPKSPAAATRQHDHGGRPMKPKNEKRKAGSKQAALQDLTSIE